jgi:hypothetical protein
MLPSFVRLNRRCLPNTGVEVLLPAIMRINAGGLIDYTDSDGIMWKADHSFVGELYNFLALPLWRCNIACMQHYAKYLFYSLPAQTSPNEDLAHVN